MAKTITQKIVFKNTNTKTLYNLYMNAKLHSQLTGGKAKISEKVGAAFSVYDGWCSGKNLMLVKDQLIVQSWRASDWKDDDVDSIFILQFEQKGKDVIANCVHANLPDEHASSIDKGWFEYYWEPWKNYLAAGNK